MPIKNQFKLNTFYQQYQVDIFINFTTQLIAINAFYIFVLQFYFLKYFISTYNKNQSKLILFTFPSILNSISFCQIGMSYQQMILWQIETNVIFIEVGIENSLMKSVIDVDVSDEWMIDIQFVVFECKKNDGDEHSSYIFNKVVMLQYSQKVIGQARKTRGYLYKKSSGILAIWQKRYFIIIDNSLSYYADETLQEVKKSIPIQEIKNIKIVDTVEFELVTKKRIYQLKADDESTRDLWVASLNILINYKEWNQASSQKQVQQIPKKQLNPKRQSKNKKLSSRTSSPPQLTKASSATSKWKSLITDFTAESFLTFICLPKLAELWSKQSIKNKALLLKQSRGCYFIISCKTLLHSNEDQDFLSEELIYPYDFNSLYYFEFDKIEHPEVIQICKCSEIKSIQAEPNCIKIQLQGRVVTIKVQQKRMQVLDIQTLIKKMYSSIVIGRQYHNPYNIKLKRNIDSILYKYDNKQIKITQIVDKEIQNCIQDNVRNQFIRNLENLKKKFKEVINCCDVKEKESSFKQEFSIQYYERVYQYIQKSWGSFHKNFTTSEVKKIVILIYDFSKIGKDFLKDQRMFVASIAILKVLIDKYQQEIMAKVNSCFLLSQKELLDQVRIPIKRQDQVISKIDTVFLSNSVFKHFHLDIRLVLYQFSQMPIHQKALQYYLTFFRNAFKHITQQTFKYLDKWKDVHLILGTCNQIEFIKNSLFDEMFQKLTKDYAHMSNKIKKQILKELQGEINNIEIMLVKKLFVLTFSDIDRNLLNKSYDELSISSICNQIMDKLKVFVKINRYVKRNIFQASFQQICYFYYTSIIKFNRHKKQLQKDKQFPADFFAKKITQDIKMIGQCFQSSISSDKIYAHLKDISLIKEFIQCDLPHIKKICRNLKKQFGNSFTEAAVKNLLSQREINPQVKQDLIHQCNQIVKNSADTPQEISLISSSRQSFLQNWNNTRSRKSTLTLSLNQFYQNQHSIQTNKEYCSKYKQGYLIRKKISKEVQNIEVKSFFKIKNGELIQYGQNSFQAQPLNIYDLHHIKKCSLHPEKGYIFFAQFSEAKLQLKAQTSDEAKEWVRNIYEEISSLSIVRDLSPQKEGSNSVNINSLQKETKDQSTMDSYQKNLKDRSLQKRNSSSPKTFKKLKREDLKNQPKQVDKTVKPAQKQQQNTQDNCLKCSKGFFF